VSVQHAGSTVNLQPITLLDVDQRSSSLTGDIDSYSAKLVGVSEVHSVITLVLQSGCGGNQHARSAVRFTPLTIRVTSSLIKKVSRYLARKRGRFVLSPIGGLWATFMTAASSCRFSRCVLFLFFFRVGPAFVPLFWSFFFRTRRELSQLFTSCTDGAINSGTILPHSSTIRAHPFGCCSFRLLSESP
jgi:hypothetical protein